MMTADPAPNHGEQERLQRQRDQAVACAVLAVTLTVMALWNNFGREHPELASIQQAVRQHRELVASHHKILEDVHAALLANQQEVERLSRPR